MPIITIDNNAINTKNCSSALLKQHNKEEKRLDKE